MVYNCVGCAKDCLFVSRVYVCQDANESDIKVQVCIYAFDLLYINGESLVSQPLRHRRDTLRASFPQVEGEFMFASSLITNDTDRVAEFLEESIKGQLNIQHSGISTPVGTQLPSLHWLASVGCMEL